MASIKSVVTLMNDGDWIESKDQSPTGIRLIQTGNIGNGEYLDKGNRAKYISEKTFHELDCTEVVPGDILISRLPDPIGRACIVPHDIGKAITAVDCTIVRLNRHLCNAHYFVYYTQSELYQHRLEQFFAGTTRTRISRKNLEQIEIPLPAINIQEQIAAKLDKVTELISLRKQQIAKLDELVKARFVEMFGDPEVNLHGFEIKSIGELVSVEPQNGMYKPQSSYVQDGTGTPILRIDAFYNGKVTDFHSLKRLTCAKAEIEKYLLHEHDIVINRVNSLEYLGKCAHIVGMYEPTVFESNMMRLHLDDTRANPCFITHLLCSDYVRKQIMNRAKKAVNQASINQNDVQSLLVLVPPVVLQHQFASFVAQTDQQKLTIQHSLAKLELLKKALMQKYFV